MSQLKVIHGTMEIANQMTQISRALRARGTVAATVSYHRNYLGYSADFEYPLAEEPDPRKRARDTAQVALGAMQEFNCFHFWFNTTFCPDFSDLPMLKNLDVPVFMQHCGSDVRTLEAAKAMNPWAVCKDIPAAEIAERLKMISRYIPTAIVGETRLYEYVKQYYAKVHMVPVAIDLEQWQVSNANETNERPLVVHAPTSPTYKGTKYVMKVVNKLKAKYDFDFQLIHGMSHMEAKAAYEKADIVIDQLLGGGYGSLSIENMALGKTVIVWICPKAAEGYPVEVPVLSANPDTLEKVLTRALHDDDLRRDIGKRARAHVERYHDVKRIAATMDGIYRGEGVDPSHFQVHW